jgi:hypothetical protein
MSVLIGMVFAVTHPSSASIHTYKRELAMLFAGDGFASDMTS